MAGFETPTEQPVCSTSDLQIAVGVYGRPIGKFDRIDDPFGLECFELILGKPG